MSRAHILDLIVNHAREIAPELEERDIQSTDALADLGLDSIDRAEVVSLVLEDLSLSIPRTKLFGLKNIGELAEMLAGLTANG